MSMVDIKLSCNKVLLGLCIDVLTQDGLVFGDAGGWRMHLVYMQTTKSLFEEFLY